MTQELPKITQPCIIVKSVKLPLSSNFRQFSLAKCKRPINTRGTEIFPHIDADNFWGRCLYREENSVVPTESIWSFLVPSTRFSDLQEKKKKKSYYSRQCGQVERERSKGTKPNWGGILDGCSSSFSRLYLILQAISAFWCIRMNFFLFFFVTTHGMTIVHFSKKGDHTKKIPYIILEIE